MKTLYVKNGYASVSGGEDDRKISYSGPTPKVLIQIATADGIEFFVDSIKANDFMQKQGNGRVSLLPVR